MASGTALVPLGHSTALQRARSGSHPTTVGRCYQCATCTSVCDLATQSYLFPRRQMLWTQWGMADKLAADPSIWLCHGCQDCTEHCPRDAKPSDVMQAARSLALEELAAPRFMARVAGRAANTWWLLLGVPILFWVALLSVTGGINIPTGVDWAYGDVVSHALIYAVFFPVTGVVGILAFVGALRAWSAWGDSARERSGSFVGALTATFIEILVHRRFASCTVSRTSRRWGHLLLFWGFVGAAVTSGFIVIWMYVPGLGIEFPIAQTHWMKILGNISAVSLVAGGSWLLIQRLRDNSSRTTGFDGYFLGTVLLVIATGVLAEIGRMQFAPELAVWIYIIHLGAVLSLFLTLPYSKFAHLIYRTLAMVHERMAGVAKNATRR